MCYKKRHFKKRILVSTFLIVILNAFTANFSNAQTTKWDAPTSADNIQNPLAGNTELLKDGKSLYVTYCSPCHGIKGKGDGAAAASLKVKPADHTSDAVQKQTDGAIYWELTEGHNPMPSYKTALTEKQRWELVNYIRTLTKTPKKS
jgi:mono/diheme cytochrome c family protein